MTLTLAVVAFTWSAATVSAALGPAVRFLTAFVTKQHDGLVRSITSGVLIGLGALLAYSTGIAGDIDLFPDVLVVVALAYGVAIGVDRGLLKSAVDAVDQRFNWGLGRSVDKIVEANYKAEVRKMRKAGIEPPTMAQHPGFSGEGGVDLHVGPDVDLSHLGDVDLDRLPDDPRPPGT